MASARRKSRSGKVPSRKRKSQATPHQTEAQNKKRKSAAAAAAAEEPELFQVAKIVGTKIGKNGVTLYKTRWEGYSPEDDTWEPLAHVAGTGYVDRYERSQRELTLSTYTPGVAVIEYDDGERQTVDLRREKFRAWKDVVDEERDDDSVDGDDDVNNFDLIRSGAMIELLWPHARIYFSCRVISWTPILDSNDRTSTLTRHGSLVWKSNNSEDNNSDTESGMDSKSSSDARGKTKRSRSVLKESAAEDKSTDSSTKKNSRSVAKKNTAEERSDDFSTKKKSRSVAKKNTAEERSDDFSTKKKSRSIEKESAESAMSTSSDDAPRLSKSKSSEKISVSEDKIDYAPKKTTDKSIAKNIVGEERNEDVPKKMAGEEKSTESAMSTRSENTPRTMKRSRSGEKESVTEGKSDEVPTKPAENDKSDGVPVTKKSKPDKKEENKPLNMNSDTPSTGDSYSAEKSSSHVKQAREDKVPDGEHISNGTSYAKKPASKQHVLKDVSDDDSEDAISKLFCKRNVSEGSEENMFTLFRNTKKHTTSASCTFKESFPDEMDIDALATAVAKKKSYHAVQTARNPATAAAAEHDDDSQTANNRDSDSRSTSKHDNTSKQKVGRGVPLYSDDDYDSSDFERRGVQSPTQQKNGPKLSFEEMWMMKLQKTQSIMDRSSGTRRW